MYKNKIVWIFFIIVFFIIINVIYAVAASSIGSESLIGKIATNITIGTTYLYGLILKNTTIKPNGWLIELNFILIAIFLAYFVVKILKKKEVIK